MPKEIASLYSVISVTFLADVSTLLLPPFLGLTCPAYAVAMCCGTEPPCHNTLQAGNAAAQIA